MPRRADDRQRAARAPPRRARRARVQHQRYRGRGHGPVDADPLPLDDDGAGRLARLARGVAGPTSPPAIEEHREHRGGTSWRRVRAISCPACWSRSRRPRTTLYDRRIRELDEDAGEKGLERRRRRDREARGADEPADLRRRAPRRPGGAACDRCGSSSRRRSTGASRSGGNGSASGSARDRDRLVDETLPRRYSLARCALLPVGVALLVPAAERPLSSGKPLLVGRPPPRRDADRARAPRGALSRAPGARPARRTTGCDPPGSPPKARAAADASGGATGVRLEPARRDARPARLAEGRRGGGRVQGDVDRRRRRSGRPGPSPDGRWGVGRRSSSTTADRSASAAASALTPASSS